MSDLISNRPVSKIIRRQRSPEQIAAILKQRAHILAQPVKSTDTDLFLGGQQIIHFRCGDSFYGVELESLREIQNISRRITAIPCTPRFILGLTQVHGEVTPIIDLVTFFGFRRRTPLPKPLPSIVLTVNKRMLALAVDELIGVQSLDKNALRQTPSTLGQVEQDATLGISQHGIVILDAAALTTHSKLYLGAS